MLHLFCIKGLFMKYAKSSFLLLLVSFGSVTYADIPKPTKCPSVEEIRRVGINRIDEGFPIIGYVVTHVPAHYYDTEQPWSFKMYIDRLFRGVAWNDAKKGLNTLYYVSGPTYSYNLWTCTYTTKYAKHVVAEYSEYTGNN